MKKHLKSIEENKQNNELPLGNKPSAGPSVGDLAGQLFGKIFGLFTKGKSTLLGSVAFMVLGVIAFWATPLKDRIYHLIWEEKVEIIVGPSPLTVIAGKSFDVQPSILNKGHIDVAGGEMRVDYDPVDFKHLEGHNMAVTPTIINSHTLKEDMALKLTPNKVGLFPIVFVFSNKYGSYYDTLWVNSEDSYGKVTSSNWSGSWSGSLGGNSLKVNWVESQADGNLHKHIGEYVIPDKGESGSMKGDRDGSIFNGEFFKAPNELVKWSIVKADFRQKENGGIKYLEIEGFAKQKIKEENSQEWLDTDLPRQEFYLQATIEF